MSKPISIWDIPREELFAPGHRMCQGCGAAILMRHITKAIGKDAIIVQATGCVEVTTTLYPQTSWLHPWLHVAFETAGAAASGVESAVKVLKRKGVLSKDKEIKIVAIGGDGGTFDIGLQSLSGLLERGHDVLYIVYDNEAYMNTGIQRSGATPYKAWTTTTPVGKIWRGEWRRKKDIISIALAHKIPYAATANPAFVTDLYTKVKKALSIKGPKFIHAFSPCVPGWRYDPALTVKIARLAVLTGMWINYEVENGEFKVTTPVPAREPVEKYLKLQGRFRHLTPDEIAEIQSIVDEEVEYINKLVGKTVIGPVKK
jgi:pyruvate ferredoxin oxidoreductase beta subunit